MAPLLAANYYLLPLLLIAALLRLLVSERLDFSLVLVTVVAVAGVVWLLDHLLFEPAPAPRPPAPPDRIRPRCRCRSRSTMRAAFSRSR